MMKIGFIGTGLMGLPMAKNLLKSGFKLKAFNRSISKAEPLKEFGAEISKTLGEVVKDNDFIITMLTDDSAVDTIMNNSDLLDNLKSGSTVIDMSSVKPTTATKYGNSLKSKNVNYLDAPVSGGTIGAEATALYNNTITKVAAFNPSTLHTLSKDIFTYIASIPQIEADMEIARQKEDSLEYVALDLMENAPAFFP